MGCACCTNRVDPSPPQKSGTCMMPPLHQNSMAPPDEHLMTLQVSSEKLSMAVQVLEAETDLFEKSAKDYSLSAAGLKGEMLVSRRILDSIRSDLNLCQEQLQASIEMKSPGLSDEGIREKFVTEHNDEFISDLQTLENVDKYRQQFDRKIRDPKGRESKLRSEGDELSHKWDLTAMEISKLIDKVEQLQNDIGTEIVNLSRSVTTPNYLPAAPKEDQIKDEANILESSVMILSQTCQQHLLLIQEILAKLNFTAEMQATMDSLETDSALARKVIEDFLLSLPFTLHQEEQISYGESSSFPNRQQSNKLLLTEEEIEETANIPYVEEVMVAAEQEESRTQAFEQNMSWMSSEAVYKDSSALCSLSAYEVFDLFENAIAESPADYLPSECVQHYIASKRWEESMYDVWVEGVRSYVCEELPYAGIILSLLQQSVDPLSHDAALLFPAVIRACNRLVKNLENDAAIESSVAAEVNISEENDKTLHTGGLMYWVECISLVYANFTQRVGAQVLRLLKPRDMPLQDYVTFQICHKMHSQQTDGMHIFQLLDRDKSGKLSAVEFSRGLLDVLRLWIDPEDVSFTFKTLYNRWSGLVSKTQFSKQVNFAEYLQKTKREMAGVSKYALLSAVLTACQTLIRKSLTELRGYYRSEDQARVITDSQIQACFAIAGEVTSSPSTDQYMQKWHEELLENYETKFPELTFFQAKKLYIDILCR